MAQPRRSTVLLAVADALGAPLTVCCSGQLCRSEAAAALGLDGCNGDGLTRDVTGVLWEPAERVLDDGAQVTLWREHEPSRLRLSLIGGFAVERLSDGLTLIGEGGFTFPWRAVVAAAVLGPGPVSRDEIAAVLWPGQPRSRQLSNLRELLRELKSVTSLAPLRVSDRALELDESVFEFDLQTLERDADQVLALHEDRPEAAYWLACRVMEDMFGGHTSATRVRWADLHEMPGLMARCGERCEQAVLTLLSVMKATMPEGDEGLVARHMRNARLASPTPSIAIHKFVHRYLATAMAPIMPVASRDDPANT